MSIGSGIAVAAMWGAVAVIGSQNALIGFMAAFIAYLGTLGVASIKDKP
jgi:hypothetical protein